MCCREPEIVIPEEVIEKTNYWDELMKEYYDKRNRTEEYIESKRIKSTPLPKHAELEYLCNELFPSLNEALSELLKIIIDNKNEIMPEDYYFNALEFLSEYLWNMNEKYPNRKENWTKGTEIWPYRKLF